VARRDEILCLLARRTPPPGGDSPKGVARWLKQKEGVGFRGLDETIPDNGERLVFEEWVRATSESAIARRVQRAFTACQQKAARPKPGVGSQALAGPAPAAPVPPPLPPLLWPFGARQRKDAEPKFKLPLLYGYPAGSERIFCKCLGERTLHEVSATIQGRTVGYSPALSPGEFIELTWNDDPQLAGSVTYNGWRDWILQYESFKDLAGISSEDDNSPTAHALRPTREFAARQVERIAKVLPPDLDGWKRRVWGYRLEIRYSVDGGAISGQLTGTLLMTMEDLWFRFKDDKGHETPIR
jgi:hypothetical protein